MNEAKYAIMAQIHAAFGQGTGPVRISRAGMMALDQFYEERVRWEEAIAGWDTDGTHALERVRAAGRMAATRVAQEGRSVVEPDDVQKSAETTSLISDTRWCGI
jgi:hypothetical protein